MGIGWNQVSLMVGIDSEYLFEYDPFVRTINRFLVPDFPLYSFRVPCTSPGEQLKCLEECPANLQNSRE